eukprot:1138848-Pelagomonas_calceolata.AAC.20
MKSKAGDLQRCDALAIRMHACMPQHRIEHTSTMTYKARSPHRCGALHLSCTHALLSAALVTHSLTHDCDHMLSCVPIVHMPCRMFLVSSWTRPFVLHGFASKHSLGSSSSLVTHHVGAPCWPGDVWVWVGVDVSVGARAHACFWGAVPPLVLLSAPQPPSLDVV